MRDGKKEKVLFVTDFYYPHWTGLSKSLYNLIQSVKDEFDITVLTVQHEKKLRLYEEMDSVRVIREPYIFTISRSKYSLSMVYKFMAIIRDYDAIFINSPCANILFIALITKLLRKKLLIFHQGDLTLPKGIINRFIEEVFNVFSFIAFSLADKIATYTKDYARHSRVLKSFLYKFYPLLLPIYLDKVPKSFKTKNDSRILLGFAGRFVEEKGFDILFSSIEKVKAAIPNVRFIFAGETHMPYENFFHKKLESYEKVKSDIELLGLLDKAGLTKFYQKMDFIIIPSRSDCFNLVQAEAMLAGTPCITSDIPGLRYMVQKTGFGVLFQKEDPDELADKILYAIAHRQEIMLSYAKVIAILNNTANAAKIRAFITN